MAQQNTKTRPGPKERHPLIVKLENDLESGKVRPRDLEKIEKVLKRGVRLLDPPASPEIDLLYQLALQLGFFYPIAKTEMGAFGTIGSVAGDQINKDMVQALFELAFLTDRVARKISNGRFNVPNAMRKQFVRFKEQRLKELQPQSQKKTPAGDQVAPSRAAGKKATRATKKTTPETKDPVATAPAEANEGTAPASPKRAGDKTTASAA